MESFKILSFTYYCLHIRLLHGFILLFALQLISCSCNEPDLKKNNLTNSLGTNHGGLRMEINPVELIGEQHNISVQFIPVNSRMVNLEEYTLTIQVEDRTGVISWGSEICNRSTRNKIKIDHIPLSSFSLLKKLDPIKLHNKILSVDLLLKPAIGSRQIVIKFQLCNKNGIVLQEKPATWRIQPDEPTPNPEASIDPNAVIKCNKTKSSPAEEIREEEILRKQKERAEKKAEEKRKEEEIRKKRGEEWLGGEGAKRQRYWERR